MPRLPLLKSVLVEAAQITVVFHGIVNRMYGLGLDTVGSFMYRTCSEIPCTQTIVVNEAEKGVTVYLKAKRDSLESESLAITGMHHS